MNISVRVLDDDAAQLLNWMKSERELRGRVRYADTPSSDEHMSATSDVLTVLLGSGGVAVVLNSVTDWLKSRRTNVRVEITRGDKTISLNAESIKADKDAVRELLEEANKALEQE